MSANYNLHIVLDQGEWASLAKILYQVNDKRTSEWKMKVQSQNAHAR
jgi:hypothetical protein